MSTELKKFVVWGSYCENVLEKRAPFRQAHLDNLKSLYEAGKLLTIGPTQDITKVFAVYAAPDLDSAKQLVEADPYWQNGIWTEYEVHEWVQVY
ncbi:YciI family protein [Pseudanabaena sp. ABRG5-3]|uniref:YciI family protein n=1 Tax=Pseudanabaena sp. ABRG5-3 TaxID=685565 RepID=UPI000DC72A95|nr:YciI family protein [Pseudanabaena sp. ABRG5-3]BBC22434.1 YciI-like protein [Pseudanabaena sp. ABRG5-3]